MSAYSSDRARNQGLLSFIFIIFCIFCSAPAFSETIIYTYDKKGQLLQADYGAGQTIDYTYDPAGNRITAQSCSTMPIFPGPQGTLQTAYAAAAPGSTIKARNVTFLENLLFASKSITLKGGYDCSFSALSGMTIIKGSLEISAGPIVLDSISIQ